MHPAALGIGDGSIHFGQNPRRCALHHVQLRHHFLQLRYKLNGAGARANHRHPFAFEVKARIPLGRVKSSAIKSLDAWYHRYRRAAQPAHGGDQASRGQGLAIDSADAPNMVGLIKVGLGQCAVELDLRSQAVLVHTVAQIVPYFGLGRIHARPIGAGLERKRIQVRGHIASATRVGVDAPSAAHISTFFEDHKTLLTGLLQAHRHAQAAKARPHNDHLVIGFHRVCRVSKGGAHAFS